MKSSKMMKIIVLKYLVLRLVLTTLKGVAIFLEFR